MNADVDRALRAMRDGASLHLAYVRGRPHWWLSNGVELGVEIANIVITEPNVISVDASLFRGLPGQGWRYVE